MLFRIYPSFIQFLDVWDCRRLAEQVAGQLRDGGRAPASQPGESD